MAIRKEFQNRDSSVALLLQNDNNVILTLSETKGKNLIQCVGISIIL